jgi:diguanylate cyclase
MTTDVVSLDLPLDDLAERRKRQQSAEVLRVVLGKMGAHADGYEPTSYAVWHEYVKGGIPALRIAIDALVGDGARLTLEQTTALYNDYIRDRSTALVDEARGALLTLLAQMQNSVGEAAATSAAYDSALQVFQGAAGPAATPSPNAVVERQLATVLAHTQEMRTSLHSLQGELRSNRTQVGQLTEELNKLREDVLCDALTGLVNRRGFDSTITSLKANAEAGGDPFSIVMIDIDHFKKINDTYGHLIGDRVIQYVAATLKSCVRGGDTAARYGGEEFVLLLPATRTGGAKIVADYVRQALSRARVPTLKQGVAVSAVTVSSGVTEFRLGESIDDCVRRADQALYVAKRNGRNCVHVD